MTTPLLADHHLVGYVFAPLVGEHRERAHRQLLALWQSLTRVLDLPDGTDPPSGAGPGPSQGLALVRVAARYQPGPPLRQLFWDNVGDIAHLSVAFAGADADADTSWPDLYRKWESATASVNLDAMIGVAVVFTAHASGPAEMTPEAGEPAWRSAIAAALEPMAVSLSTPVTTRDALAIIQVSPIDTDSPRRDLIVLAAAGHDEQLSRLVWDRELSLLSRYLLHAAKLRYQGRVLRRDRDGLRQRRCRISDRLTDLQDVVAWNADAGSDTLAHAARELTLLQAEADGVVDSLIQARTMRRTVSIAAANMATIAAAIQSDPTKAAQLASARDDFFTSDQATATELDQDLDDEIAYLDAAQQRAQHFADLTDREMRRRAQLRDERQRRRQEHFTLAQTAIIGAVLMALTAIQALGYQIPLPGPLKPAVITALGTAALWLAAIALRLANPATPHDEEPRRAWQGIFEVISFGMLAASLAWFVTTLLARYFSWFPGTTTISIASMAAGFTLGAAQSGWSLRRRTHKSEC
jgi:hypothetical protein